jgi:leucyl aminopeptidase
MKLNINILISKEKKDIDIVNDTINISLYKPTNFELSTTISKLNNHLKIYSIINEIIITFDKSFESKQVQKIVTKLDNVFYSFYPNHTKIKYNNIDTTSQLLVKQLKIYKDTVMETQKTPETHLKYIKDNLPKGYKIKIYKLKVNDKLFPLTAAVGQGSQYNSYFVHICKKTENKKGKNIVFIGKSITYDSGGLNIKVREMNLMKTDMTGSAIILNVLNLLVSTNQDKNNIHLLIPIAENMVGSKAVRPGVVIKSLNGVTVEITNTDAEGRLCMADAIEYFTKFMQPKLKSPILLDIATLTGNVCRVTSVGGAVMCNDKGRKYTDKLIKIGSSIGEYLDYLQLRDEYSPYLKSPVAEINNHNPDCEAGTTFAGAFLNYFVNPIVPYIHIDVGCGTFEKDTINSYGILLLYKFLKKL